MVHFTPVSAAVGGLLIGLSAALLWVAKGRIAGISGILGGLGALRSGDVAWRAIFLVGLMAAPLLYGVAGGALPEPASPTNPALLVVGGLLVGFGTRLGNGCTSGHGVCGLARLSQRSLTATALFMVSAAVNRSLTAMPSLLVALVSGLLFGLGLTVSSMIDPAKVLNFLDVAGSRDPRLAFVTAAAIPVAAVGFVVASRRGTPLVGTAFHGPKATAIDRRLVTGAVLFGVGWGLVGYCPGPALATLGLGASGPWLFVAAMLAGMAAHDLIMAIRMRRTAVA
ncbi:DUF6691 family protein [Azospirillum brasilense]